MCFRKAKWKREVVNDHKFDFVCVDDFKKKDALTAIKFIWLYLVVIKSILVYIADLWTAGILLIFDRWSSTTIKPSFEKSRWIYVGCIFISFALLAWDWKKAKSIIASKDISYAFTSIIASRYYALRSYAHHCFFEEIHRQKRKIDRIAFFVFFTFKGWKKFVFAEAPRQLINAITLYKLVQTNITKDWTNFGAYGSDPIERLAMALMGFSLLVFAISAIKLAIACILYIPLLFHIRGNLKEYCCHKIDKRIDELVKKESNKRRLKLRMIERAVAKGDVNHLTKKDILLSLNRARRRQPTLPNLDDDDNESNHSIPPPVPPVPPIYLQPPPESIISPSYVNNNRLPPPHLNMSQYEMSQYEQYEINLFPPPPNMSQMHHELTRRSPPPPPHLNMSQHEINRRPPSPHLNMQHEINRRPPSPHLNMQHEINRRTPSPPSNMSQHDLRLPPPHQHELAYNSNPHVRFQPAPVRAPQDERFNPNNYHNQYNPYNNQSGYGRR